MDFVKQEHTWVSIKHPTLGYSLFEGGPRPIVLHTGPRVWVSGCAFDPLAADGVVQVGDGTSAAFDEDGNCVLSVPAEWCVYHTDEEAQGIEQCLDADERLLAYARG